ncbi:MAG TPA: ABC transporter ATP-binding protein [Candidatus Dormibacteraeota bacterium]|jgi:ATP-binding cassette subfamily B protein|nr:ABC transporter ATP-binding protein [Candidatus Dormibacteraeota bacterium]
MRLPDTVRLIVRFGAFRPRLVLNYLASDVIWSYALFLLPGLVVRAVLDSLAGGRRAGLDTWSLLALLAGLQLSGLVIASAAGWYSHQRAHQTFSALTRANLLARILRRPGADALACPPAQAIARFDSDADLVGGEIVILEGLAELGVVVAAVAILLWLTGWVAVVVMVPLVAIVVGVSWASERIRRYRQALQQSVAELSGLIGSVFGALVAVRTLGAEEAVGERFRRLGEVRRRAALRDGLMTQAVTALSSQSYGIAIGVGLIVIAQQMRSGALTVGDLSLFVTYAGSVATAGSWLGGTIADWGQYRVSLERLGELAPGTAAIDLAESRPVLLERDLPAAPRLTPAGEPFRELTATGLTCLHVGGGGISGVDLTVRAGELVAVTGRIGSGKTTLLRALLGLLPASGDVLWNGSPVADRAAFMVPPRCGYLAQAPVLMTGTVRENLLLGLPPEDVDLSAAVSQAAMESDLAGFPRGLDTVIGRRGLRLSGGQIQRVAAARMLARRPQLAVVDDLSSALDMDTEAEVWERIRSRAGMACLAVTHRRTVLRLADRVIVMRHGRVDDAGTLPELLDRCAEMRALWREEADGR